MEEKVVLNVWLADYPFFSTYGGEPYLTPMRKRAEMFGAAHPNYQINIRACDYTTMVQEVGRAAAQGRPPDIAGFYVTDTQRARDLRNRHGGPLFTPVEKAVAGRVKILGEPVVLDDILPAARDFYSDDGELVSLPTTVTTPLLFTNRTVCDAAGVAGTPRTWDEVAAACKAVAALDGGPSHGITWADHGWLFEQAVAAQGGLLADHDNGRSGRATGVDLASPEMLAWVRWWQRLHQDGHYLYTGVQDDWAGTFESFAGGRVAFLIDSSKSAEEIAQAGREAGFRVEASRMPYNGLVPYAGNVISGDSLWLAAGLGEARRDGALAFMQYLVSPHGAADWHRSNGFVPVTGASFDLLDKAGWFEERPHQRAATEQLLASDRSPAALGARLADIVGVHDLLSQAMEDVLIREADPAARFALATAGARRLLDDHGDRRAV